MKKLLAQLCSVKKVCEDCPFRLGNNSPKSVRIRHDHIAEMKGDILYRAKCVGDDKEYPDGNYPICRGSAVYMAKKAIPNALLHLAYSEGVIAQEDLLKESESVVS